MMKETQGIVISVSKQWWLKVNTKPFRKHALDGAVFPYIVMVQYTVDGHSFVKRKWIHAGKPVPGAGSTVTVLYDQFRPQKAKVLC